MILDGIEWRRFKQVTNWCASDTSVFSDDGFSCVAEPDRCLLSCLKETITLAAAISRQAGLQLDCFAGHSKQEQQCLLQAAHIYTFIYLCDFFFFLRFSVAMSFGSCRRMIYGLSFAVHCSTESRSHPSCATQGDLISSTFELDLQVWLTHCSAQWPQFSIYTEKKLFW